MKSTKKIFTLLIFSIAVAFTGCQPEPVGSLLYSVDYIKIMPKRNLHYGQYEWFIPELDVKVIGVFGGVEEEIASSNVRFKLIYSDSSYTGGGTEYTVASGTGCELSITGPYTVVLNYRNLETRYAIIVGEPGTGGPGWGGGSEGGGGGTDLEFDWPYLQ
jgi:hypothetical protein